MPETESAPSSGAPQLRYAARVDPDKILSPQNLELYGGVREGSPVLVVLAAGKGTRFGQNPKCIERVSGTPLARHSIDAFRRFSPAPAICLVGYRHEEVSAALGSDNVYVLSDNPAGGTGFAAFEAFSVAELLERNPLLVITMGDRIVPMAVFQRLCEAHSAGDAEADLTFLSAVYEPPKNRGKGRVLRGETGKVLRVLEERDILLEPDESVREQQLNLTEGNCPLYAVRAATLYRYLQAVTNDNAQGQFYLTDIIEAIASDGGEIRSITTRVPDPEYDLLCSDVTQPMDLALLEGILTSSRGILFPEEIEIEEAVESIVHGRPKAQVASIARQLSELLAAVFREKLAFHHERPVGIGISGGRLRIAFMHPDMVRFFGPAWQMPIGAGGAEGNEQIVILAQPADDRRIHLLPMNPQYRENINFVPSDSEAMYPGDEISDMHSYEAFGTRMSESLLLSLGYFSDEEVETRRRLGIPLPPQSLWVGSNMRRPFALVGNAIASLRTLRTGNLGSKVQEVLGRQNFRGLRLVSTGSIPQGGFSSSSAVTVATKNAINALFHLGIPPDLLVHLACQAEYGTGVRAGSLDQATEQKGRTAQGTLISSNPRDNYRILGTFPMPADRIQIVFPYSVERDRGSWRWSGGAYGESPASRLLSTGETRKMTGKAAEIASVLCRLPLDTDFFKQIEDDLVSDGLLSLPSRSWICTILRQLPLLIRLEDLRAAVEANRNWYAAQLQEQHGLDSFGAGQKADSIFASFFTGWREPVLRRTTPEGEVVEETGVPLRAMTAYLFGEVAKNFYLVHHPQHWIEFVTRSQRGDCCFEIDPGRLPARAEMERELDWERKTAGPERLERWLEQVGAKPFNFNRGLEDDALSPENPPDFSRLEGSNFFRGLALLDLGEAMLHRAFGADAAAVRVNAAGQGDYFQVHVDRQKANPADVKRFLRNAFYRRFGLAPDPEFVELHPGGGASGIHLSRFGALPQLVRRLDAWLQKGSA
ncbi:MAG: NTP transferase domain-containing protein [Acidobacteria bacterium]|nr:NTP transferase domain-containing protein [Acidobacteriota bacterium]